MTEKRFMVKPPTISDDLGIIDFQSGEAMLTIGEIVECLNALHEENEQIKNTIHETYQTERTELGKSVLKQLLEQIQ